MSYFLLSGNVIYIFHNRPFGITAGLTFFSLGGGGGGANVTSD